MLIGQMDIGILTPLNPIDKFLMEPCLCLIILNLFFSRGQNQGDRNLADMVLHQLPTSANGWNTHGMTQKDV